ncbi:MAG: type II toxin-antitoxin system PemK/MazF family toxin [Acidobacteriota bacterium]|nr:type II toxin-antitoxin system PemK/MazF family toxin [Acidobacteriota bacterium]MDQ3489923.1 type II toxin-antitoxin system PemK/MazF family toxin [Acidobacteriota bacterium]
MVVERGEIWWADLPEPRGSMPGYKHPFLIIQSDKFNQSSLETVIGVVVTTNLRLAKMPGNILLTPRQSGLPQDSVANLTQIVSANKSDLLEYVGSVSDSKMDQVAKGLRIVLSL